VPTPTGLTIDPDAREPLYRQIAVAVRAWIEDGSWPAGFQLAPTRDLARELDAHRNTVVRAYDELRAGGFVTSTVGRGTFVAAAPAAAAPPPARSELPWDSLLSRAGRAEALARFDRLGRRVVGRDLIELQRLQPSADLLPAAPLRRCPRAPTRRRCSRRPSPGACVVVSPDTLFKVGAAGAASGSPSAPSLRTGSGRGPRRSGPPWRRPSPGGTPAARPGPRSGSSRRRAMSEKKDVKVGLAEMLQGGVIMDVVDAEQARIAEEAGAAAVMALERVPAKIRAEGGVARATDPALIKSIQAAVSIPVMAKCRIGHFMEARILEALKVDFIDESEVLTPADEEHHIDKRGFRAPFVCGCRDLGEALRRVGEGAALLRTKGEAGTGNIVEAVRHLRAMRTAIRRLGTLGAEELMAEAKALGAPFPTVEEVARTGRLPVPMFAAGGVATPADAALCMALGAESVFVGSGIFLSADPPRMAKAIVLAATLWEDPQQLAAISEGLGDAMPGLELGSLAPGERMAGRGW